MPRSSLLALAAFCFLVTATFAGEAAGEAALATALPRSTPEHQGIASSAILAFVTAADQDIDSLHSFMLIRHGQVVAECWWKPYDAQTPHMFYSLSKSFTSTAVGLAIAEGKMSVDDEVLKAFADEAPTEPSANLKAMRVRDLLRMQAGHEGEAKFFRDDSTTGDTWTKRFLAHPVTFKPGTRFVYNTPATFMASAMVQKATGQNLVDYLRPRLFEPLGWKDPTWVMNPQGVAVGGYGLMGRTEDIAKFGQLYLQQGMWNGKQLIPAAWVKEATTLQTSNGSNPKSDWDQGYCYQFWRCQNNAYRGDGAFGQYCVVMPDQDAVIAITGGLGNMQAVLNLVWSKLLPAMQKEALAADEAGLAALAARLAGTELRHPASSESLPLGIHGKWYALPENDRGLTAICLDLAANPPGLMTRTAAGEQRTPFGIATWSKPGPGFANGVEKMLSVPTAPLVSGSGAWTAWDTFTLKLAMVQTPFTSTMTFKFTANHNQVTISSQHNVAFGPTKLPELIGQVAAGR